MPKLHKFPKVLHVKPRLVAQIAHLDFMIDPVAICSRSGFQCATERQLIELQQAEGWKMCHIFTRGIFQRKEKPQTGVHSLLS